MKHLIIGLLVIFAQSSLSATHISLENTDTVELRAIATLIVDDAQGISFDTQGQMVPADRGIINDEVGILAATHACS